MEITSAKPLTYIDVTAETDGELIFTDMSKTVKSINNTLKPTEDQHLQNMCQKIHCRTMQGFVGYEDLKSPKNTPIADKEGNYEMLPSCSENNKSFYQQRVAKYFNINSTDNHKTEIKKVLYYGTITSYKPFKSDKGILLWNVQYDDNDSEDGAEDGEYGVEDGVV